MATTMRQLIEQLEAIASNKSGSGYYQSAGAKLYNAAADIGLAGDFDLKIDVPASSLTTFAVEEV